MVLFAQINAPNNAQANREFRPHHIVIGQYLGFTALLLASLPGYLGGLVIPKPWIGLLGLLPIVMGVKSWLERDVEPDLPVQTVNLEPITVTRPGFWRSWLHPRVLGVALVTVANGGDNIGIYVPLFASSNLLQLGIILAVFFLLIALWCGVASALASHPKVALLLSRYAQYLVPLVLMGLGIFILIENGSYRLLYN